MGLGDVTREGVLKAIRECDERGRETFLRKYGFRRALAYDLVHEGRSYDSKAIAGVAHLHSTGCLLPAGEFSGGAKSVARRLAALGFTVEHRSATETDGADNQTPLTRQDMLHRLRKLRTHRIAGRHQPLTLLWAISRMITGKPRLTQWPEFRDEVGELLAEFGSPGSSATPEYPFWYLRSSEVWEIRGLDPSPGHKPRASLFDKINPAAGLTEHAQGLLQNPLIRAEAVAILREAHLTGVDHHRLFSHLGLAGYETATGFLGEGDDLGAGQETGPVARRTIAALRLVRDSRIAEAVKDLYGHQCQVCGLRLRTRDGYYSEAAHIRGLGRPHDGPDQLENLLCLCPNHHVQFDALAIYVDTEGVVRRTHDGTSLGVLRRHETHVIDGSHVEYHRALCGRNS